MVKYLYKLATRYAVRGKNQSQVGEVSLQAGYAVRGMRTELIERLSMTFTPNGKRRSEIRVLPKMEEPCLILAHFCPVSSIYQATSQRNETS